jgi:hypothetical protein
VTDVTIPSPWPIHPATELFPMIPDDELRELSADITANGLHEPVWLWDDPERGTVLLDGRNRLAACAMAGVDVRTRTYDGNDPISFVVGLNVKRRHLNASQLAFIALEMTKLLESRSASAISAKRAAAANARWERQRAAEYAIESDAPARREAASRGEILGRTDKDHSAHLELESLVKQTYFIRAGDRVKVGVSWNPAQRLEEIRKHNPDAELLGSVVGAFDVEHAFHRRLEDYAEGNEWFRWTDEVFGIVAEAMQNPPGSILHPDEIDPRGVAARKTGASRAYVTLARKVERDAPDLVKTIRDGDMDLKRAGRIIRDREAEARRIAQAQAEAAASPEPLRVDIRHGDFREVLADLGNVDAVITDPPYPAEFLPLLADLADWADKVLTPDGVMAVLIGQTHLPEVYRLMDGRRPYRWTGCYLTEGNGYVSHPRRVQSNWKPIIVYGGGPRFADVIRSEGSDAYAKSNHKWGQDYAAFHTIIERLTARGQTVADPFMGSGTTLLAAHALGRHVIGCDVDPASVDTARGRIQ